MRWVILLGGLAVLAMGVLIGLVLLEDQPGPGAQGPAPVGPVAEADPGPAPRPAARARLGRPAAGPPAARPEQEADRPVDEANVEKFGQEFEARWRKDRDLLGPERHREMEQLWFAGRRPRGSSASIEKLERLLSEFPDTNRAGCASLELGHHFMRSRELDPQARRARAAEHWHLVESRYADSLCEYNAPAAGLSKLALATWVYRSSDPGQARRLLEEVIAKHPGETDHLGRPLQETAQQILERLK